MVKMRNKDIYRKALRLAVPMMIQNGITNMVGLVDNLMVGSLGTEAVTAVSIVGQLIFVFNLAIFGGLSGPGIYSAQFYGQQNTEGVRNAFRIKLMIAVICFIGGLEIDKEGNVNGHISPSKLAGIGGFANITQNAKKVVFTLAFSAGGLKVDEKYGQVTIVQEGKINKFVEQVNAVSFAAENAHAIGQEVLYVTERCVFRLGPNGLVLTEVYPGIDMQKDILDQIPFEITVDLQK